MKKRSLQVLVFILSVILLMTTLTGCEEKKKEGDILRYTKETVPEGYHVLKEDGYYYPFLNLEMSQSGDTPFFWFTKRFESQIIKIGKNDQIVYKSYSSRPNSYRFLSLRDFGYTIGGTLSYETYSDGAISDILVRFSGRFCPYSPIESILSKQMNLSSSTITEINGKPFREIMINPQGFIKGLDPMAMYRLGYYNGTVYNSVDVMSDTRVLLGEAEYISRSFIEDKESLFLVNMPNGMRDGFYFLENGGLFEWVGDSDDLIEKQEVTPIKEKEESSGSEDGKTEEKTDEKTKESESKDEKPAE